MFSGGKKKSVGRRGVARLKRSDGGRRDVVDEISGGRGDGMGARDRGRDVHLVDVMDV